MKHINIEATRRRNTGLRWILQEPVFFSPSLTWDPGPPRSEHGQLHIAHMKPQMGSSLPKANPSRKPRTMFSELGRVFWGVWVAETESVGHGAALSSLGALGRCSGSRNSMRLPYAA